MWRLDDKGEMARLPGDPGWTVGPAPNDHFHKGNRFDRKREVTGMVATPGGRLLMSVVCHPGKGAPHSSLRMWDREQGWTTLAGPPAPDPVSPSAPETPRDGVGGEARFGILEGMALDADTGKLYLYDLQPGELESGKYRRGREAIRVFDLKTGAVTTLKTKEPLKIRAHRYYNLHARVQLRFHQGRLHALGRKDWLSYRPWVVSIDLKSGQVSHPFENPVQGGVTTTAGPCSEGARGVPSERCGTLPSKVVEFDLDDEGRIGLYDFRRIGLLLLDGVGSWSDRGNERGNGLDSKVESKKN